jgi:polyhydroxyalkanoate synthesis regulator phasin
MTTREETQQAYNQLQTILTPQPSGGIYNQPFYEQLPSDQKEQVMMDARQRLSQTGNALSNFFGSMLKNRYGSPFVVGSTMDQFETGQLGLAEDATQVQAGLEARKDKVIKNLQQGKITSDDAKDDLDVINERQRILDSAVESKGGLVEQRRVDEIASADAILEGLGETTQTEAKSQEVSEESELERLRRELKELQSKIGTTGGDSDTDDNFFDRLNSKVDLMAMGAAMLANAGSGRGTFENLGVALQTGLKSRQKQDLTEEAKKRADAQLAIQLLSAQNKGRLTNPQSVGALESELRVYGAEGDNVNTVANYLYNHPIMGRNLDSLSPEVRRRYLSEFVDISQGWMGDEIEMGNVIKASDTALERILKQQGK